VPPPGAPLDDTAANESAGVLERRDMTPASSDSERSRRRRFSMLRDFTLADFITLSNGCAGTASIFCVLKYLEASELRWLWYAILLLPLAMVFDYLDGTVARWRRKHSPLGAQLDLISFGVAPAVIAFGVGMRGGLDALVLVYFVSCGLSRLARYNVTAAALADDTGKVKYYEGTPIPTSVALVVVLGILLFKGRTHDSLPLGVVEIASLQLHPLVLLYFLSGSAMVSKTLRVPKP
jgi:CDP-diacylglycerol--serine O-phosphatidyltransferase